MGYNLTKIIEFVNSLLHLRIIALLLLPSAPNTIISGYGYLLVVHNKCLLCNKAKHSQSCISNDTLTLEAVSSQQNYTNAFYPRPYFKTRRATLIPNEGHFS